MKNELARAGANLLIALFKDPEFLSAIDPALQIIGSKIGDSAAKSLLERHANALVTPKDAVVPVSDCCKLLKISKPTFKKYFLDTGKLHLVDPPDNADRRSHYVSAKEFQNVIKAVPMQVVRINKAAA